ncbi:MAG: glycoside hydrolase family 2 protein [Chloroflexota bacterium]
MSGSPGTPRPEYPRPQLVRPEWLNLNGRWEFGFDDVDRGLQLGWHDGRPLPERITVPFPYQSALSGIDDQGIHEVVWYARSFAVPPEWQGRDLLLNFGAVDYRTTVWVNGREVGHNRGGHVPFRFDVAPYLRDGENRLALRVEDRQDPHQPRGKQASSGRPHGIDYYCTTGIWQTVWLEPAPPLRIDDLVITPLAEEQTLELWVYLHAPATGWRIEAEALDGGAVVAHQVVHCAGAAARLRLTIPDAKPWSPDTPHLYDLRVRLLEDGRVLDEVESYAGMRSVAVQNGRLLLNGEPIYLAMVLDQGYWPESYLAAPSDDALRADVEWVKRLGFNGARKHQKIEDPRWLYWCDRLGLLVWAEMPNARAWSPEAEDALLAEWERAVARDYNHPCVVTWVPVNESMGFPGLQESHPGQSAFLERIVAATRRIDPVRPVIDNDGWEHTDVTDICAIHDYTQAAAGLRQRYQETLQGGPLPPTVWYGNKPLFVGRSRYRGQPVMLTEVGGFLALPADLPEEKRDRLYQFYDAYTSDDELLARYRDLLEGIAELPFLAGFCYTQFTDIEQEVNGLLTYDRRSKIEPEQIAEVNHRLLHRRASAGPTR